MLVPVLSFFLSQRGKAALVFCFFYYIFFRPYSKVGNSLLHSTRFDCLSCFAGGGSPPPPEIALVNPFLALCVPESSYKA